MRKTNLPGFYSSFSPAIDTGTNKICPLPDQHGVTRPCEGDKDGTATSETGAHEYTGQIYQLRLPILRRM